MVLPATSFDDDSTEIVSVPFLTKIPEITKHSRRRQQQRLAKKHECGPTTHLTTLHQIEKYVKDCKQVPLHDFSDSQQEMIKNSPLFRIKRNHQVVIDNPK